MFLLLDSSRSSRWIQTSKLITTFSPSGWCAAFFIKPERHRENILYTCTLTYTCIIWWQSMTHSYLIFLSCEHFDVENSLPAKDRNVKTKKNLQTLRRFICQMRSPTSVALLFVSKTPTGAVGGWNGRKSWALPNNCHNLIKADKKRPLGESRVDFF